ncbi:MAG TPA: ATP-binding protein [Planctomycetota bacterium]|nr:ATP-binding protein [Planctomycetota bacterium]
MITDVTSRILERSGHAPVDTAKYHIDPENAAQVAAILRNMYARPDLAVFREYITNALDAHQFQQIKRPIEVHPPNFGEPYFSVRDFGGGLDVADTKRLLLGYAASGDHKRASNDQIGGFGIGCKSAFSLCDSFTYKIWHGGKCRVWSCYLDEHDAGHADMIQESDSSDLAGIEVRVPFACGLSEADAHKFTDLLDEIFAFMPDSSLPKLIGSDHKILRVVGTGLRIKMDLQLDAQPFTVTAEIYDKTKFPGSGNWPALKRGPVVVQGGSAFELSLNELKLDRPIANNLEHVANTVFTTPIGLLQLAPSREELQYSLRVKKLLKALLEAYVGDAVLQEYDRQLEARCKSGTLVERAQMHVLAGIPMPKCPGLGIGNFTSDGWLWHANCTGSISTLHTSDVYIGGSYVRCFRTVRTYAFDVGTATNVRAIGGNRTIVVRGSQSNRAELALRAVSKLLTDEPALVAELENVPGPNTAKLHVFTLPIGAAKPAWLAKSGITVYEAADLKDVTMHPLVVFENTRGRHIRGGSIRGARNNYTQHARKFCKVKSGYEHNVQSQNWGPCKAADISGGVYVVMDRFLPKCKNGSTMSYSQRIKLRSLLSEGPSTNPMHALVAKLLPQSIPLLGVREAHADSIGQLSAFTMLDTYVSNTLTSAILKGEVPLDALVGRITMELLEQDAFPDDGRGWLSLRISDLTRTLAQLSDPRLAKTALGKSATWWHTAALNTTGPAYEWAKLYVHLATNMFHPIQNDIGVFTLLNQTLGAALDYGIQWDALKAAGVKWNTTTAFWPGDPTTSSFNGGPECKQLRCNFELLVQRILRYHPVLGYAMGLPRVFANTTKSAIPYSRTNRSAIKGDMVPKLNQKGVLEYLLQSNAFFSMLLEGERTAQAAGDTLTPGI